MNPEAVTLVLAIGGACGGLVMWLVRLGRAVGHVEQRIEAFQERLTVHKGEDDDLDVRIRHIEQLLPALATKVDSQAQGIAELKTDMRAGFARIEGLLTSMYQGPK